MARTHSALPIDMITRLLAWLDSYAGAEEGATDASADSLPTSHFGQS